jgi:GNAT superfamily N-acetyltransferase
LRSTSATTIDAAVREPRATDIFDIARLCTQLGYPTDGPTAARRMLAILAAAPDHALLVAANEFDTVVGFVHVGIRPLLIADRTAEICGLVVDESVRGKGHGKRLMMAAEQWAREAHCAEIALRSNVVRTEAHEFYKALGYAAYKTSLALRKKL